MAARGFDSVYRSTILKPMIPRIFGNGLGNPLLLEHLITNFQYFRDPEFIGKYLSERYSNESPIKITQKTNIAKKYQILEGTFVSPFNELVPKSLPAQAATAYFKMLVPHQPPAADSKPAVIHLSGTGDYSVTLQEYHADRLTCNHGVASLLLINPFYKKRRPELQKWSSSLLHMSDLFVMGGSLMLECSMLLRWLESEGYGPLALHGISLGGFMASLAASVYSRPLPLVPCLSWTTSSPCYVRGVLSNSMSWEVIQRQLAEDGIFKERLWPLIRDASCPAKCRVPSTLADPLRPLPPPTTAESSTASTNGKLQASAESLQSLRTRIYSSVSGLGFGLFAAGGRMADTLMQTLRQPQHADAMEAKHRQQHLASATTRDPKLTPEEQETREFVTCLLDYFTHMANYERPLGPVYSLQALDDAYVPRDGVYPLNELWPGMECRVVKGGHVTTILKNCHWASNTYELRDLVLRSVGLSAERPISTGSATNS